VENPERLPGPADPDPPCGDVAGPSAEVIEEAICREMLAIHRDSYGRDAGKATAHLVGDTLIVLLDGLELLPSEQFLLECGRADPVETVRNAYQKAIEATYRAAVERATGRRVIGFASHVHLDEPRFVAEIFRLEAK
jgi:uncharacterized protein YbcI